MGGKGRHVCDRVGIDIPVLDPVDRDGNMQQQVHQRVVVDEVMLLSHNGKDIVLDLLDADGRKGFLQCIDAEECGSGLGVQHAADQLALVPLSTGEFYIFSRYGQGQIVIPGKTAHSPYQRLEGGGADIYLVTEFVQIQNAAALNEAVENVVASFGIVGRNIRVLGLQKCPGNVRIDRVAIGRTYDRVGKTGVNGFDVVVQCTYGYAELLGQLRGIQPVIL